MGVSTSGLGGIGQLDVIGHSEFDRIVLRCTLRWQTAGIEDDGIESWITSCIGLPRKFPIDQAARLNLVLASYRTVSYLYVRAVYDIQMVNQYRRLRLDKV